MFDEDSRRILTRSYTAWAFYVLAAITAAPDLIYALFERDTNPAFWSIMQYMTIAFGVLGRILLQPSEGILKRRAVLVVMIAVAVMLATQAGAQSSERQTMRVLVPLVMKWEGEHRCQSRPNLHCAYLDIVGVPTICHGETKGVKIGDIATDAECRSMLQDRLSGDFRGGLHRFFTPQTRQHHLTPERDAAFVSLAYNVGVRGAGRSTATRRLNAGNISGACRAIGWWNRAGGRVVRGLVNRRSEETRLCLSGV